VRGRGSLYEKEVNFGQVILGLALAPLSAKDEALVRGKLAEVIGRGLSEIELSKKLNPGGRLQTDTIAATLKAIVTDFRKAEPILRGLQTGFHAGHQIEAAARIREALEKNRDLSSTPRPPKRSASTCPYRSNSAPTR
jgi:hypothetical protein